MSSYVITDTEKVGNKQMPWFSYKKCKDSMLTNNHTYNWVIQPISNKYAACTMCLVIWHLTHHSTTQVVHFTFPTDCQIWEDKPVYLLNTYWHYLVCTMYHLRFHVTFLGHRSLLLLVFSHKWPVLVRHHMLLLAFWCSIKFQSYIMLEWRSDCSIHQLRSCFAITYSI